MARLPMFRFGRGHLLLAEERSVHSFLVIRLRGVVQQAGD